MMASTTARHQDFITDQYTTHTSKETPSNSPPVQYNQCVSFLDDLPVLPLTSLASVWSGPWSHRGRIGSSGPSCCCVLWCEHCFRDPERPDPRGKKGPPPAGARGHGSRVSCAPALNDQHKPCKRHSDRLTDAFASSQLR